MRFLVFKNIWAKNSELFVFFKKNVKLIHFNQFSQVSYGIPQQVALR